MTGIVAQNVGRPSGLIKAVSVGGAWTLISTFTSDGSDADATFDSGIDSTYPIYLFKFINMHPETDEVNFQVNFRDGSTAYDATKQTNYFHASLGEDNNNDILSYLGTYDQVQSTSAQTLSQGISNDADHGSSGKLWLFNPSSTVFVKHFIARINGTRHSDIFTDVFVGGYCNVTAAIDGVQFKMSSGEIQGGKIKMYGLKDSA